MAIDKWVIEEWGNALTKISGSERWTFMFIMITALISIVLIVIFYIRSIDWLVAKYNETINKQQTEFLQALKEFRK